MKYSLASREVIADSIEIMVKAHCLDAMVLISSCIKILLLVYSKGEVRHSELESLIRSRGTLSSNLNDLLDEGLLKRNIIASRPIQSNYSLTERGKTVAKILTDLRNSLRPT